MKRRHELPSEARAAQGGLTSIYASAGNESHRKAGSGHGEHRKRRRAMEHKPSNSAASPAPKKKKAAVKPKPTNYRDDKQTPSVYRRPAAKY